MKRVAFAVILIMLLGAGYLVWHLYSVPSDRSTSPISIASYLCDEGKTIQAAYYLGKRGVVIPGQPPVPGGSVQIALSDGRQLTLSQTISGSGIRYSDGNPSVPGAESIVFWSKGNTAFVTEQGGTSTYQGCIAVLADPGNLPRVYESGSAGFSIRYPEGYRVDPSYAYTELGPGKTIAGVKFSLPPDSVAGTNLSSGSYISVEKIPNTHECTADLFLFPPAIAHVPQMITENGTTYSVASSTDAAVGNRYEEDVYAIPGTNPCIGVRYYIHWNVLENYPEGTVHSFSKPALFAQFDAIRRTLVIGQ